MCSSVASERDPTRSSLRTIVTWICSSPAIAALAANCTLSGAVSGADLDGIAHEASVAAIGQALSDRRYTVTGLAGYYVGRIGAVDQNGPALHSIIEVNPDWQSLAQEMDRVLASGAPAAHRPLFGVPVVLKDNIDTADRMQTTAGSLALLGSSPQRDAFIVRRLRAAGALILGKANMSEWAGMRDFNQTAGWSARGGQTRNPHDPARSPGGSSSGSAVAVAADFAAVAIGTDTGGSISFPASVNGVVGIRPTVGLVSRSGIIPICSSYDTAGPLARTVADAAAVLTVIAGYDPDDPATAHLKNEPPRDFRLALKPGSLKGARIGVLREYAGFSPAVVELFDRVIATLRAQGAIVIDPVSIPTKSAIDGDFKTNGEANNDTEIVQETEFKDGIKRYLATRRGPGPKDLQGLIDFDNEHAAEEMPHFGQDVFTASQRRGPVTDKAYRDAAARARRLAGPAGIDAALGKDRLDALVAPTAGPASLIDHIDSGVDVGGGHSMMLAAAAGYPRVTVPMGQIHGLPVSITLVGTAWSEFKLIGIAYAYEQAARPQ
jgi:amidase